MPILGKDNHATGCSPKPLCATTKNGHGRTPRPLGLADPTIPPGLNSNSGIKTNRDVILAGVPRNGVAKMAPTSGQQNSRRLTQGEINLAKSIFGEKVKYDQVAVFHKKFIFFQPKDRLMTPNGNIYAASGGDNYSEDYSKIPEPAYGQTRLIYSQAEFIHEMTHVWQHQVGMSVEMRGMFERNYDYDLATLGQKDFKKYEIEEEAQMVEDYYILLHGGSIYRNGKYIQNPPSLKTYEQVLKPYFPLNQ